MKEVLNFLGVFMLCVLRNNGEKKVEVVMVVPT
jgi:hypothetical protein